MNMTALGTLVNNAMTSTFLHSNELLTWAFLALLILILATQHADRISSVFILSLAITTLTITGILETPILFGIMIIGGGILTAKTIILLFTQN